ncbi:hypothetical protein EYF80_050110 [Liparis tanakae]|uniref:Uncharacterized protein n=1 Tax=Liparis tanakae TaxID=230148 RepID=A0A4Z2FG53_9TELE|nr:hypothetical protein EYF80_050110 [Liparis tanakae]
MKRRGKGRHERMASEHFIPPELQGASVKSSTLLRIALPWHYTTTDTTHSCLDTGTLPMVNAPLRPDSAKRYSTAQKAGHGGRWALERSLYKSEEISNLAARWHGAAVQSLPGRLPLALPVADWQTDNFYTSESRFTTSFRASCMPAADSFRLMFR